MKKDKILANLDKNPLSPACKRVALANVAKNIKYLSDNEKIAIESCMNGSMSPSCAEICLEDLWRSVDLSGDTKFCSSRRIIISMIDGKSMLDGDAADIVYIWGREAGIEEDVISNELISAMRRE